MREESLKSLSDETLDRNMKALVKQEREILVDVLKHLREVNRRKLFAKLKYKSLAAYCEHHLGYSYDQAWRRVEAMKLLRELPQIEQKIAAGSLNLTNIGLATTVFKEKLKREGVVVPTEKLSLLTALENKTKLEAEKHIAINFGKDVLIRESVKPVSETKSLLTVPVDSGVLEKIEKLKGLFAHSIPFMTTAELLDRLCDLGLKRWTPANRNPESASSVNSNALTPSKDFALARNVKIPREKRVAPEVKSSITRILHKRYIPAAIRRAVWSRDRGTCTNCDSKHGLQFDHIVPFAKGGRSTIENLRLLCRNCNQRSAIEQFGAEKIETFAREAIFPSAK